MMSREVSSVVGPQLRLYGTINLCMCDASIILLTPRANPEATVHGVAELEAGLIKVGLVDQERICVEVLNGRACL